MKIAAAAEKWPRIATAIVSIVGGIASTAGVLTAFDPHTSSARYVANLQQIGAAVEALKADIAHRDEEIAHYRSLFDACNEERRECLLASIAAP